MCSRKLGTVWRLIVNKELDEYFYSEPRNPLDEIVAASEKSLDTLFEIKDELGSMDSSAIDRWEHLDHRLANANNLLAEIAGYMHTVKNGVLLLAAMEAIRFFIR